MKDYHNANRKKIRGWKRRIRQVDKWGENIKRPFLDYFLSEKGRYTYDRCILYPFYTLEKRHPPLWFYKLIIAKLVVAYYEWANVFEEIGVPYDLQIWLYDPSYIRSEIICYKMQENERQRFVWESELSKPFPFQKFSSPGCDLTQFNWLLADEEIVIFEADINDEDNNLDVNQLLADGYLKKEQGEKEVYYAKRIGDRWIGRSKNIILEQDKRLVQGYFAPPSLNVYKDWNNC